MYKTHITNIIKRRRHSILNEHLHLLFIFNLFHLLFEMLIFLEEYTKLSHLLFNYLLYLSYTVQHDPEPGSKLALYLDFHLGNPTIVLNILVVS